MAVVMPLPTNVSLPVFLRVGDSAEEFRIGEIEIDPAHDEGIRQAIAAFLRGAAHAFEHPEQEDDDAPAHR
ncbi:hypothetical protein [Streptomyces odonnellii]|uniref:hypothetical protein n=1 Tax=Streptomyces odonnellii TaxID=1417980 RepID=UPI000626E053|nr:hypothetical protein [Streptomyces odonnellii]